MKKTDILCIGIACVDVLVKGVDFQAPFTSETKHADRVSLAVGGDAANAAVVISKLGHSTKLMCGIGPDSIGDFILEYARRNDVDTQAVQRAERGESAVNVILIKPDGQRNFVNSGVPEAACYKPDLDAIRDVRIVSMGSLFLPPFHRPEYGAAVAAKAKEIGAVVCADVVVDSGSKLQDMAETLKNIDYLFLNKEEARLLTGTSVLNESASRIMDYGVANVIIKTGASGCFVKNAVAECRIPGYKVDNVADTTGAGDNFMAGFMSALLHGRDAVYGCRFGCATAALSIQTYGAAGGITGREQVLEFMEKNVKEG